MEGLCGDSEGGRRGKKEEVRERVWREGGEEEETEEEGEAKEKE